MGSHVWNSTVHSFLLLLVSLTPHSSLSSVIFFIDMERYYVLIDAGQEIDHSTKFFHVAVGSTQKCLDNLIWLQQWCKEHNCYFKMRSEETDTFLLRIAESLGTKVYCLPSIEVKVRPLVAHLKNFNRTPEIPPERAGFSYFRKQIDHKFYLSCHTSCRARHTY